MFFVNDNQSKRHDKIRSLSGNETAVGAILASVDFEWTLRRTIVGCGLSPTAHIKKHTLDKCHGLDGYSAAWRKEVYPLTGTRLPALISEWQFLKTDAMMLRHRLVHGIKGTVGEGYAARRREALLNASVALVQFASENGVKIYGRIPTRRKPR